MEETIIVRTRDILENEQMILFVKTELDRAMIMLSC